MKTTLHAALLALLASLPTTAAFAQNYGYPVNQVPAAANCPGGVCPLPANVNAWQLQNTQLTNYTPYQPALNWTTPVNTYVNGTGSANCPNGFCATPIQNQPTGGLVPVGPAPAWANGGLNGMNIPAGMQGIAMLPVAEQAIALQQRTCPISGHLLGSQGVPYRTVLNGRSVYVCCEDCVRNQYPQGQNFIPQGPTFNPQLPNYAPQNQNFLPLGQNYNGQNFTNGPRHRSPLNGNAGYQPNAFPGGYQHQANVTLN